MYQYPNQTLFYAALFLTYFKLFSLILKDSCNIGKYKQSQNSVEKRTNLAVIFFSTRNGHGLAVYIDLLFPLHRLATRRCVE